MRVFLRIVAAIALVASGGTCPAQESSTRRTPSLHPSERLVTLHAETMDLATALRKLCALADVKLTMDAEVAAISAELSVPAKIDNASVSDAVSKLIKDATKPLDILDSQFKADECRVFLAITDHVKELLVAKQTYSFRDAPLRDAAARILKDSGSDYLFAYDPNEPAKLNLSFSAAPLLALHRVLRSIGGESPWTVKYSGNLLLAAPNLYNRPSTDARPEYLLDFSIRGAEMWYALKGVMMAGRIDYTLDVNTSCLTICNGTGLKWPEALRVILDGAYLPIKYHVEGGIYNFVPDIDPAAPEPRTEGDEVKSGASSRCPPAYTWEAMGSWPDLPRKPLDPLHMKANLDRMLHEILKGGNVSYAFGGDVEESARHAKVEVDLPSLSFGKAIGEVVAAAKAAGVDWRVRILDTAVVVEPANRTANNRPLSLKEPQPSAIPPVSGEFQAESWHGFWDAVFAPSKVPYVAALARPVSLPDRSRPPTVTSSNRPAVRVAQTILNRARRGPEWFASETSGIVVVGKFDDWGAGDDYFPRIDLHVEDLPVDRVLKALFKSVDAECNVDGLPPARVSARVFDAPFESVIHTVLQAAYGKGACTLTWKDNVCRLTAK